MPTPTPTPTDIPWFVKLIKTQYDSFKRIGKQYYNEHGDDWFFWISLIVYIIFSIAMVGFSVAFILGCMMIIPFLLIWAINVIAPLFGVTLVIPYSIPVLLATAVVLMVLRAIFKRG